MLNKRFKKIIVFVCCLAMACLQAAAEPLSAKDYYLKMLNINAEYSSEYKQDIKLCVGSDVIYIGNEAISIDTVPVIYDSRTYIPLRAVTEIFDADISYEPVSKTIIINNSGVTSKMQIGSNILHISYGNYPLEDEEIQMPSFPLIDENDRCIIPIRSIAEDILGCEVGWNAENKEILICRIRQSKRLIAKTRNTEFDFSCFMPVEFFCNKDMVYIIQFGMDVPECVIRKYEGIISKMDEIEYVQTDVISETSLNEGEFLK